MSKSPVQIVWFRQDLRLSDNPALLAAAQSGTIIPIYILDDLHSGTHAMGGASRWWLHHSLSALNQSLDGHLLVFKGDPIEILKAQIDKYSVTHIYWNRCYEPWRIRRDAAIKSELSQAGITVKSMNGSLLWEPWTIKKADDTPYKVFTPFYRKGCLQAPPPRLPTEVPETINFANAPDSSDAIDQLGLLPKLRWDKSLELHWQIGEAGAKQRFEIFLEEGIKFYKDGRNLPAKPYVSRLSAPLHFGEVSPNQLWYGALSHLDGIYSDIFCSELGWREFSYSQLYHQPDLPTKNLQAKFDLFPWIEDDQALHAWQKGQTGIPMVDAGMRELWKTGYMHNRVRMIVGSFLVKNLRLHWHHGERWFWDTLIDADLANNSASWQWIAGCGADAAPYFRVFSPVTQGKKFDPDGVYVRNFIPELAAMPDAYLFNPWEAPEMVLRTAGVTLGETYPNPIVDLKQSRLAALDAFKSLKTA